MKKRAIKLCVICLALVFLAVTLMPVAPASAANLSWSQVHTPAVDSACTLVNSYTQPNSYLMTGAADGRSLFAFDNTNYKYYRSLDGGLNWIAGSSNYLAPGLPSNTRMAAMAVSSDFAGDGVVAIASETAVYASSNGGSTFGLVLADITASFPEGRITSLAVSPFYTGGISILVGVKGPTAGAGGALAGFTHTPVTVK